MLDDRRGLLRVTGKKALFYEVVAIDGRTTPGQKHENGKKRQR